METILGVTGHRPSKLGGDYEMKGPLSARINIELQKKIDFYTPTTLISGMALGVDTIWAKLAIRNKLKLIAAIPFPGQDDLWPLESRKLYEAIISYANTHLVVVSPAPYAPAKMQVRNEWIVDHCTRLIGVWDGSPGGTKNCIEYAENRVPIDIINPLHLIRP